VARRSAGSRPPAPGAAEKRTLGMESISLDQDTLEIQLAEELPQHRPLVVVAGGVAGLADRHTKCGRIERDLCNERRAPTGCRHDRPAQGLAVTDQLIEIRCATGDLSDRPVTDHRTQGCHVHLLEEVAERGVRWRPPQLQAQRLGEHGVVADGESLQIPQALAATQDSQYGHQQQISCRERNPASNPCIGVRPQVDDQVEISGIRSDFKHKEGANPPTSTHADRHGKRACDGL
jgi:hypothetical protein